LSSSYIPATVPLDEIHAEVQSIINKLVQNSRQLADYDDRWEAIQQDGRWLGILCETVSRAPGDLGWKPRAREMRDIAMRIAAAADGPGRNAFVAASQAIDEVQDVRNGNGADVPPPEPLSMPEVAPLPALMQRLSSAVDVLRNSPAVTDPDSVPQAVGELRMMAVVSDIIHYGGYEQCQDADFRRLATEFGKTATSLSRESRADWSSVVPSLTQRCSACHERYRIQN
jgi:hypothetical protein